MGINKLVSRKLVKIMRLVKVRTTIFIISLIFLFLGVADIFSLSGLFLLLSSVLLYSYVFLIDKPKFDSHFLLLLVFIFSYCIPIFIFRGFSFSLINNFAIIPIAFYIFSRHDCKNKNIVFLFILTFIMGYLFRCFLLLFATINIQGFHFVNFLTGFNWFTNDVMYVSRNGLSLFFAPFFATFIPFLFEKSCRKKWWKILIVLLLDLIAIATSLIVGNRAFVVCAIFWLLLQSLIFLFRIKNKVFFYISLFVYLSIIVILLLIYLKIIPLPGFIMNIYAIQRFINGGSNSERISFYIYFFQNFYRFPFGGMYNDLGRYLHNFYLDIYNFSGAIPFVLMTIFIIIFLKDTRNILYNKYYLSKSYLSRYILWMFIGLFSLGMIEPIFQTDNVVCGIIFFCFGYMRGLSPKPLLQRKIVFKKEALYFREINI